MTTKDLREWLEALELEPDDDRAYRRWLSMLPNIAPHLYASRQCRPAVFTSHEQRLQVYSERCARQQEIFHVDDVHQCDYPHHEEGRGKRKVAGDVEG